MLQYALNIFSGLTNVAHHHTRGVLSKNYLHLFYTPQPHIISLEIETVMSEHIENVQQALEE